MIKSNGHMSKDHLGRWFYICKIKKPGQRSWQPDENRRVSCWRDGHSRVSTSYAEWKAMAMRASVLQIFSLYLE